MKRLFDISISVSLAIFFLPLFILVYLLIYLDDGAPVLYWSRRVGKRKKEFIMPKFRTMKNNTPQVATHLLKDEKSYLTRSGSFIRKTSLDEIPQLWSVIKGDMSLVGPRPALFNQEDLVKQREGAGVNELVPGITGWAQINGRDSITIEEKVEKDREYLRRIGFFFDLRIIFLTFYTVVLRKDVKH